MQKAREYGLEARRAFGSNGQALGLSPDVDVIIENITAQVKARRKLPGWLSTEADVLILKEDRGPLLALIPLSWLLAFLRLDRLISFSEQDAEFLTPDDEHPGEAQRDHGASNG